MTLASDVKVRQAPRSAPNDVDWLKGTRVLTIGDSTVASVAARVLRQLGADVVRGEDARQASAYDVVLVDRVTRRTGLNGVDTAADDYLRNVAEANTAVWVSVSAYGLTTDRRDAVASEFSLLAAGGILGHSRIGDEWAPTVPVGSIGLKLVGYVAAVSALHALHVRRAGGGPLHVDLSAQQAVVATGLSLEMAHALSDCPDEGGSARYGAPSGFFDCLDGRIYVLVLEQHQWWAFQGALQPRLDEVATLSEARDNADFVNAQLAEWAATRTAEECEQILQGQGVPCTVVNTLTSLEERTRRGGRELDLTSPTAPPLPAALTVEDGAPDSASAAVALSDLRVLDAGNVLAVPLGAAWLGAMGAQVIKLEDPDRLDIYRRRGPFAQGVEGLNRSAYFNQLNFNKTTLDLPRIDGKPALDYTGFDVVMKNVTPRRAKSIGIDTDSVFAGTGSQVLAISSSGFGGTGPFAGYRAYGHNIHAFSGMVAATRDAKGEMGDMGTPWADPLTSVCVAAWTLAWALTDSRPTHVGVDISMAELTAAQLADLKDLDADEIYRAREVGGDFFFRNGAQLMAVSLSTEDEVRDFESIVGRELPQLTVLGELVDLGGAVDPVLDQRLLAAGIAASVVYTAHDLAADPYLQGTGLFQTVESAALGRHRLTGLPWQFVGTDRFGLSAAPERADV
ncbi:CoA transferase [Gordonia hydrophobica]|uniref:CoA transferase n=1 Tax=Gordonia hydrophobica TaxID=40516 RepID=A0ABZ2U6W6_9ACTN|nr:CoA transferase [Gordonia hydrophobica]MBM7365406.1 crotonobetainyl-CoA:carnitine CoA-transferase CaiB-like acyl-CoA transferase [Gordonia hydrophobica]